MDLPTHIEETRLEVMHTLISRPEGSKDTRGGPASPDAGHKSSRC
jgi:hypothetical protein